MAYQVQDETDVMLVLLPKMWGDNDQDFDLDFSPDERSPVKVFLKPWGNDNSQCLSINIPYSIVRAKKTYIQPKKCPQYTRNFSDMNKKSRESRQNIKNQSSHLNSGNRGIQIQPSVPSRKNAETQTNISGIISHKDPKWNLKAPKSLSMIILWTLMENCFTQLRRYNEETYDISMLTYLSSAKTYNMLRNLFPLPAFQNLYEKYGDQIRIEKKYLTDINELENVINKYKIENGLTKTFNDKLVATLAIDAFAFKSFQTTTLSPIKNQEPKNDIIIYNNGFIFLFIPIDFRFPPKILYIEPMPNGNYNQQIDEIASHIRDVLQNNGFRIWFKATDGDKFLSSDHDDFFHKYVEHKSSNFLQLVHNIYRSLVEDIDLYVPVGDPLHLWKSVRTRYLKKPVALFANSPTTTDYQSTKNILDLGKVLDDFTSAGKMRDIYALKLFTLQNVSKLLKESNYADAIFLFPFSCWICAAYSLSINLSFRLFLIEIAFQLISTLRENFGFLKSKGVLQKAREETDFITFHEDQYMKRMMNSLIATAISLIFASDFVRVDGIGTHLVENQIGIARQSSSDPRWQSIITSFAHAEMRKKIAHKYNISLYVPGRINDGGCKVDEISDSEKPPGELIEKPEHWGIQQIIQLFIGLCNPETSKEFEEECMKFIEELDSIGSLIDINERNINDAANNGIIARLILFSADKPSE